MGLIKNKNNNSTENQGFPLANKETSVSSPPSLTAQQRSFKCSYSKDLVVALLEKGLIGKDEVESSLKEFGDIFEKLLME